MIHWIRASTYTTGFIDDMMHWHQDITSKSDLIDGMIHGLETFRKDPDQKA